MLDSFTVSDSLTEKTIKFNLHSFEILFINNDSKSPYTNLNLVQTYRGKTQVKKTNALGKISVRAMPGFALNYKLRDGTNLIAIIVDKNKSLRTITIDPKTINKAAKNLANNSGRSPDAAAPDAKPSTPEKDKPKPATGKDSTPKRDKTDTVSGDGRPKTVVNDHVEAEFTVLTYDKKTNTLFSGGSYTIEYKGNKKIHASGLHGLGKKVHKGDAGEAIKISIMVSSKEVMVFDSKISANMKPIEIKLDKPKAPAAIAGVTVSFNGVSEQWRRDLVSEKTKNVLAYLAKEAGMSKILITSTIRTSEAQAIAMYGKTTNYKGPGEAVKKIRNQSKAKGDNKQETIRKMVEKIDEFKKLGKNVSLHCVTIDSYKQKNVVDIGLNSNGFGKNGNLSALGKKFEAACNKAMSDKIISGFISGNTSGEGAMHIEILQ